MFATPKCAARQSLRRGFTLVELLVVVGVIAVLVSMLLPALQAAREQARLVDDLTRIRQLAIAANMYAADYGGSVPPLVASISGMPWQGYAIWSPGGYAVSLADPALPQTAGWPDLLQMYLDPQNQRDQPGFKEYSQVMYCSADADAHDMTGTSPAYTYFSTLGWWGNLYFREPSYRMNPYVTGVKPTGLAYPNGAPIYGTKFANVRNPGRKVFFVESHYEEVNGAHWGSMMAVAPFINGQILSNQPVERWAPLGRFSPPRHRNGFVACYFDGSAQIHGWDDRTRLMQLRNEDWNIRTP